jgi:hypothetical protein
MYRLLNKWLGPAGLFCGAILSAQPTPYEFQKLKAIDTIGNAEYQKVLGSPDVKSNKFLVSKWKGKGKTEKLALFKKSGDRWIVFSIYEEQTIENVKLTEDEQYLTYVASSKIADENHSESHAYFCIIDLTNEKQMPILQQSNDENWNVADQDQKGKDVIQIGCSAQIVFLGKGNLTSIYTASNDFNPKNILDDCLPKGQYTVRENILVKIK